VGGNEKKNALLFFFFEVLAVLNFTAYSVMEDLAHLPV